MSVTVHVGLKSSEWVSAYTLSDLVTLHICEANSINIFSFVWHTQTKTAQSYIFAPVQHHEVTVSFKLGSKNEAKSPLFPLFHLVSAAPFPPNWNQVLDWFWCQFTVDSACLVVWFPWQNLVREPLHHFPRKTIGLYMCLKLLAHSLPLFL